MSTFAPDPFLRLLSLEPFPLSDPKTEAAREAERLHGEAQSALDRVQQLDHDHVSAQEGLRAAEDALDAAVVRAAGHGQRDPAEEQLVRAVESARIAADDNRALQRHDAATRAANEVITGYEAFIREHAHELYELLRPEAEKTYAAVVQAKEATSAPRIAYAAVADRADVLGRIVAGRGSRDAIAPYLARRDEYGPALPSDEILEELERRAHPERFSAPVAEDETVLDGVAA